MGTRFYFSVAHPLVYTSRDEFELDTTLWTVSLPHSCDRWRIAEGVSQAEAVEALQQFISEAQAALVTLQQGSTTD